MPPSLFVIFILSPSPSLLLNDQCLQHELLNELCELQVDAGIKDHIQKEVDYLDGKRPYLGYTEAAKRRMAANHISIRFLTGEQLLMPVTHDTTVKDINVFLGEKQGREPRFYRLMLGSVEMKVRHHA